MQALRQLGSGILFAIISVGLILGSLSAALTEGYVNQPRPVETETSVPTRAAALPTSPSTPPAPPLPPPTIIPSSPSPTATIAPPTACPPPIGWLEYIVQIGDSVDSLAQRYTIQPEELLRANCLFSPSLIPDTRIYVPPFPTQTPIPCGPPYGWITYTVKVGDNLYRISLAYRVSVAELQNANCLGYSTRINAGQRLYVPNVPTSTPAITNTPSPTNTFTPTITVTVDAPTWTPSATNTFIPATATATNTATPIPTATETSLPTNTATKTPAPTATFTSVP